MKYYSERQMQAKTLLRDGDYKSIRDILDRLVQFIPEAPILAEADSNKQIVTYNATRLREEVMNLGDGLIATGLKDKHISIVADNCCRYVIADICISSGVGVVTPVDVNASVELLTELLGKCDADAVVCSSRVLGNIDEARKKCSRIKTVITIDRKVEGIPYYEEIVAAGEALKEKSVYRNIDLDLEKPAKILFTSGTTGPNKGVVLSNANLIANAINCMDTIRAVKDNTAVSILPMHHATEINTHIITRIASGKLTYINDSIRNMMANLKLFKPDNITIVPMIANSFYNGIWATAAKNGKAEKLKKGIELCNMLRKVGINKTHSMFAEVFAPFGGRLNMIVCGGAMLNPKVVKGMNDLGIRMENGYGITECGPLISMNSDTLGDYRSVGKPCPGLEVKIDKPDEDGLGELCVRGKSVSKGYYKDPEATAQAFDSDGFFHTGDKAYLTEDGRIILAGRKKNTIVLENGKNVCPEEIENVISTELPYAADVVVYHADYVQANSSCKLMCAGLYIPDDKIRADREKVVADIKAVNELLPDYKKIEYLELPEEEYHKTGTRKIIRSLIPETCSKNGLKIY